ncbi:MAG TPA: HlyD family secretion protein [Dongiaceae bacterium]|nr:HlyD family secretion protein [Dongiaceae bacterium]
MIAFLKRTGRIAVTLVVVALAGLVGRWLWVYYMDDPWTRDARVRAEVTGIAPDVSGLVADILVQDNQVVHRGDILFRLDRARFTLALAQAKAVVESRTANWQRARTDARRYAQLDSNAVSQQRLDQATADAVVAEAALHQAEVDRDLAALNLERSEVRAPLDGIVTNLHLQPGDYVNAGTAVIALVDTATLHIDGYFEETKLAHIQLGDPVRIRLMGDDHLLRGRVESVAGGIADRERDGDGLLANINPTFSWVRLAQRVPVRITIDAVPDGLRLIPGRTATVAVGEQQLQGIGCDTSASGDRDCNLARRLLSMLRAWLR